MKLLFILCLFISFQTNGAVAPAFDVEKLGGGRVALKDHLKKDRYLFLSFWATWCAPCLEELTKISALVKENPTLPLDVLSINVDSAETASDVKPTAKMHSFKFLIGLDSKHEVFSKYQFAKSLPYSVLIRGDGEVVKTFQGLQEGMLNEIKSTVGATRSGS